MRVRSSINKLLMLGVVLAMAVVGAAPALGGGRPLSANLQPGNEVPPAASSEASGIAEVTVNQGRGEVCFDIDVTGFTSPVFAAHIHEGEAGVNGPVVVTIFMDPTNPIDDFTGIDVCATGVEKSLAQNLRQGPSDYYINIHSQDFPGGELRGQLTK